jgi:hypothetical protein
MKIRILGKGFQAVGYGYLKARSEVECSDSLARYAVEKMKAAEYIETPKQERKVKK